MPSGPHAPIRRAQLIAPFGAGALTVLRGGTSVISCGLDHWYEREDRSEADDVEEYRCEEWRLQHLLGVSHFRLPPDYRRPRPGESTPNAGLTVPFLRFPQWHFCPVCKRLDQHPLVERGRGGRIKCRECEGRKKYVTLFQVPFVAMCDLGHLQDFPWRAWVHKAAAPTCTKPLRLVATGSASLAGQSVRCECGASRTLSGITGASPDGTTALSSSLDPDGTFPCQGHQPWLGSETGAGCGRSLRGSLRSASNLYFAHQRSAIYLPRGDDAVPSALVELLDVPPLSTFVKLLRDMGGEAQITPQQLRSNQPQLLQPYNTEAIAGAIRIVLGRGNQPADATDRAAGAEPEDEDTAFRKAEYQALRTARSEPLLTVREADIDRYDDGIARAFSRVMLVDKLRETRALAGFTRVYADNQQSLDERKAMLWRHQPDADKDWLPAYVVFGEGLFFELDPERLRAWEGRDAVAARAARLDNKYKDVALGRKTKERRITPRLVLLHTLAHLLINRLTFECGYSSAALRERLYVSTGLSTPMCGMLIYTADGDAEGTMGGLVRMGKHGYLEPLLRRALEGARWCSADPICMELGSEGYQGPDSCNLAACHNCALVPETACEEFNRFLDRGLVVGDLEKPDLGYFDESSGW